MKTATMPPLRVDPALRTAAESVLAEGESLSSFVTQSILDMIRQRQAQAEFRARGLASREEARRTGRYHSAAAVLADLDRRLKKAEAGSVAGR